MNIKELIQTRIKAGTPYTSVADEVRALVLNAPKKYQDLISDAVGTWAEHQCSLAAREIRRSLERTGELPLLRPPGAKGLAKGVGSVASRPAAPYIFYNTYPIYGKPLKDHDAGSLQQAIDHASAQIEEAFVQRSVAEAVLEMLSRQGVEKVSDLDAAKVDAAARGIIKKERGAA